MPWGLVARGWGWGLEDTPWQAPLGRALPEHLLPTSLCSVGNEQMSLVHAGFTEAKFFRRRVACSAPEGGCGHEHVVLDPRPCRGSVPTPAAGAGQEPTQAVRRRPQWGRQAKTSPKPLCRVTEDLWGSNRAGCHVSDREREGQVGPGDRGGVHSGDSRSPWTSF